MLELPDTKEVIELEKVFLELVKDEKPSELITSYKSRASRLYDLALERPLEESLKNIDAFVKDIDKVAASWRHIPEKRQGPILTLLFSKGRVLKLREFRL